MKEKHEEKRFDEAVLKSLIHNKKTHINVRDFRNIIETNSENGDLILMHPTEKTVEALPKIIKTLNKKVIKKLKKGKTYTVKVTYLKDTIKTTVKVK